MRTSPSQFLLMVEFMERNGDLSKPADGPQARISAFQNWTELTDILNSDATGDSKTSEKWRKVWSDLKNNTKKKAARLIRYARSGRPGSRLKLTSIEERVMGIVGFQAAVGLMPIPEVVLKQEQVSQSHTAVESSFEEPQYILSSLGVWAEPGTSTKSEHVPAPSTSPQVETIAESREASRNATPVHHSPRRERRRPVYLPMRGRRIRTQSDLTRQAFLNCDHDWRAFQRESRREDIRLREREMQQQDRWLDLLGQVLELGNRYMNYLEKK